MLTRAAALVLQMSFDFMLTCFWTSWWKCTSLLARYDEGLNSVETPAKVRQVGQPLASSVLLLLVLKHEGCQVMSFGSEMWWTLTIPDGASVIFRPADNVNMPMPSIVTSHVLLLIQD